MTTAFRRPPFRGRPTLRISVTDARGRPVTQGDAAGLGRWLARAAPRAARGAMAIAIVSDERMRALNRRFRRKDRVTDVLSFTPFGGTSLDLLGDLAIARGLAARQARRHGHSLRVELRILALHGLLHLLGYDHDTDRGEMSRLEGRLRRRAGLPSGLIARESAAPGS
jgi:probable rRNA maturation factor